MVRQPLPRRSNRIRVRVQQELVQSRVPVRVSHRNHGGLDARHMRIEAHRAKLMDRQRTAKKQASLIEQEARPAPVARCQDRKRVLHVTRGLRWINEHDIDARCIEPVARGLETVKQLESTPACLTDAHRDEPPLACHVAQKQTPALVCQ